jgi:hypothetical protein
MQKILSFLFLCSSLFASQKEIEFFSSSDLEPYREFSIHQDSCMRVFYVKTNDEVIATILSSARGQFDFYDGEKKKRWSNLYDSLFDDSANCIGKLVWEKDPETKKWFWEREHLIYKRMSYINIYSGEKKELLAKFHPFREGDRELCVFSDGQTEKPLAIAYWYWTTNGWFSNAVQNWQVYIVDRPCLQMRNISDIFLIWVLLKHSQDHFSFGPYQHDYVTELPLD